MALAVLWIWSGGHSSSEHGRGGVAQEKYSIRAPSDLSRDMCKMTQPDVWSRKNTHNKLTFFKLDRISGPTNLCIERTILHLLLELHS